MSMSTAALEATPVADTMATETTAAMAAERTSGAGMRRAPRPERPPPRATEHRIITTTPTHLTTLVGTLITGATTPRPLHAPGEDALLTRWRRDMDLPHRATASRDVALLTPVLAAELITWPMSLATSRRSRGPKQANVDFISNMSPRRVWNQPISSMSGGGMR